MRSGWREGEGVDLAVLAAGGEILGSFPVGVPGWSDDRPQASLTALRLAVRRNEVPNCHGLVVVRCRIALGCC